MLTKPASAMLMTSAKSDYFRGDCASGRVLLINLRLSLIIAARYKNVGGGWVSTGAVKQGGCAALNSALRSVMAQLRRGVYTYFMTEA